MAPHDLKDYAPIVGRETVEALREKAEPIVGVHVENINSTHYGGGVAEILNSLVYLLNDIGVHAGWRVIKGNPDFFNITKKIHNAMQGEKIHFTEIKKNIYMDVNKANARIMHIGHQDCVVVHDPQPLPLIHFKRKRQPWVWRVHIDLSAPYSPVLEYLKRFIRRYDLTVVSNPGFTCPALGRCRIEWPSIDPLSAKNEEVKPGKIKSTLSKRGVEQDKPIVSQISRFDKWKDPLGVISAFNKVREKHACQLVLLGNMADDDPEGTKMYDKVCRAAEKARDVTLLVENNDFLVNCLQRASDVVVQKSKKEGFGLTVSEALWKGTPVVGGNVGGIPLQVEDGKTGYVVSSVAQCAKRIAVLLEDEKLRREMGSAGREHVRENFLITREMDDYMNMLLEKPISLTQF